MMTNKDKRNLMKQIVGECDALQQEYETEKMELQKRYSAKKLEIWKKHFNKVSPVKKGGFCELLCYRNWRPTEYIPIQVVDFHITDDGRIYINNCRVLDKETGECGETIQFNDITGTCFTCIISKNKVYFHGHVTTCPHILRREKETIRTNREKYPKMLELFGSI